MEILPSGAIASLTTHGRLTLDEGAALVAKLWPTQTVRPTTVSTALDGEGQPVTAFGFGI